jgi:hypothetical protein
MIRLCAFSDEADASLAGQIAALKDNGICLTELRSVSGKNVKDFIGLLSHYIQHAPVEQSRATGGLYEHITKKHDGKPCGSYAVSIAIEKLPGDFKTNSKKQKQ